MCPEVVVQQCACRLYIVQNAEGELRHNYKHVKLHTTVTSREQPLPKSEYPTLQLIPDLQLQQCSFPGFQPLPSLADVLLQPPLLIKTNYSKYKVELLLKNALQSYKLLLPG